MTSRYTTDDIYCDAATGVLHNKLNITDEAQLSKAETDLAFFGSIKLAQGGPPLFNLAGLKYVHYTLFSEVYGWAGEIRSVPLAKGGSRFASPEYIVSHSAEIFRQLSAENNLQGFPRAEFCQRAAYYLSEINAIHPFREGNGRTQREFLGLLAREAGFVFDWTAVTQEEITAASIEAMSVEPRLLTEILLRITAEI